MSKIEVQVRFIKAALLTAGKQDVRYHLNGILIECVPFATYVVSTDGHRLMVCRDAWTKPEPQEPDQLIVPRNLLESAIKGLSKGEEFITVEPSDGETKYRDIKLSVANGAFTAREVGGRFPDWRRVVPEKVSGKLTEGKLDSESFAFDPDYLHDFGNAASILSGNRSFGHLIDIQPNGSSGARVHLGCDDAIGVIMPFRSTAIHPDIADWYKADRPKVEKPEAAAS